MLTKIVRKIIKRSWSPTSSRSYADTISMHFHFSFAKHWILIECDQIYFLNYFYDGEFSLYGSDVLNSIELEPERRDDPMSCMFPKVAKCTMYTVHSTNTVHLVVYWTSIVYACCHWILLVRRSTFFYGFSFYHFKYINRIFIIASCFTYFCSKSSKFLNWTFHIRSLLLLLFVNDINQLTFHISFLYSKLRW